MSSARYGNARNANGENRVAEPLQSRECVRSERYAREALPQTGLGSARFDFMMNGVTRYAADLKIRSAFVLMMAALSFAGEAHAQQRIVAQYSRVLLPFHASVRNAEGVWSVNWWIRNDGDRAADVFPVALGGGLPLPPEFRDFVSIVRYPAVRPRSTLKSFASDALPSPFIPAFVPVKTNTVGAFIYVEDISKSNIAVAGTVGWRPSGLEPPPPTSLRAVPAAAFLSGRHSIVAVPGVQRARYDLRIYALHETVSSTRVTIRVYDTQAASISGDDQLVHSQVGNLELPVASLPSCFQPCDVPTTDLAPASLQIINLFGVSGDTRFGPQTFRIEIEPESADVRWWAVASTMDQATRHINLYQPSF